MLDMVMLIILLMHWKLQRRSILKSQGHIKNGFKTLEAVMNDEISFLNKNQNKNQT